MYKEQVIDILKALQSIPVQLFGIIDEENNTKDGRQKFVFAGSKWLSSMFGASAKYIMPSKENHATNIISEFDAYYLKAELNKMKSMELCDKADFFITDNLTACTFLAVQINDKFKVYHLNVQDEEGKISKAGIDKMIDSLPEEERENIVFRLDKEDYSHSTKPVLVLGVRNNDHWSFHYQINGKGSSMVYMNSMNREEKKEFILRAHT